MSRPLEPIRVRENGRKVSLAIDWDTRCPQSPLFRSLTPDAAIALATELLVAAAKVRPAPTQDGGSDG